MKKITSTTNGQVKHLVKLQNKAYRQKHQQFIAQGIRTCTTLIEKEYKIINLYLTENFYQEYGSTFDQQKIILVSDDVMKKISTSTTPSGILAVLAIQTPSVKATGSAIALYNIQDPGNLGTLIRTAAAMNISTIYLIEGVDPYNPKVIQSTAGTFAYVHMIQTDWNSFVSKHKNFQTCALVVDKGSNPDELNLADSILVIGNEAQGLPQEVIDSCTQHMTIPMPGNTESLNAAVAGSIAMYIKTTD